MKEKVTAKQETNAASGKEMYSLAIQDFIKMTRNDPSFFKLSPEEQKQKAMEYVQKVKEKTQ
ncbi:hypothetical protein [Paenibacillus polymyxa]|uniref:Uncharacterized protein n=1 Tax=Paenibacillus polymyxa (strain SC2) TaxID=886882 RepID=E3EJZ8_PAEPS|nr:hypothetical protein [Paenibacillus polymyxa]ADO60017.1 hypothetical protein PPSC2_28095 [Paenibacillus polymyxa SC2]WPQ59766.1 hypothetical protein SKN87_26110 [Paenibacillus polymyxa]